MKLKVTEYFIGKIESFSYEMRLDLNAPDFLEQFAEEREKSYQKYLEMKRRIINKVLINQ